MARDSDSSKVVEWRKRVRRFERGKTPLAQFCQQEGVSTPSFYRWRKRLLDEQPSKGDKPAFQPVRFATAARPMAVHLPGNVHVEVPMDNLDAVRAVLRELLRGHTTC
jgi:hypothetical protein